MIHIDLQNLFDREADPFLISNQSPRLALNPKPKTEATSLIQIWILEWKTKSMRLLHVGLIKTNVCVKNTCRNGWLAHRSCAM